MSSASKGEKETNGITTNLQTLSIEPGKRLLSTTSIAAAHGCLEQCVNGHKVTSKAFCLQPFYERPNTYHSKLLVTAPDLTINITFDL